MATNEEMEALIITKPMMRHLIQSNHLGYDLYPDDATEPKFESELDAAKFHKRFVDGPPV